MAMIIEAKSKDPKQQGLRDRKRAWNMAVKEFKQRLQAFQAGINGRGSHRYGIPVSNIQDKLPLEIGLLAQELVSNFQQLTAEAERIEAAQAAYSANRRKPQEKKPPVIQEAPTPKQEPAIATPATAPTQTPASPLQEALKKASLIKQASTDFPERIGKLRIGDYEMPTLLAITHYEQERGLMEVPPPAPVMSFVYSRPNINRFWMQNTPSPLDIVFSLNGTITGIHKGEPYSTAAIGDYNPSDLVVELPRDTCKALGITIGDPISLTH